MLGLGMTVGWNTFEQLTKPRVFYGLSPKKLKFSAWSTSSVTYPTSRTWANTVKISGLDPATTYCAVFVLYVLFMPVNNNNNSCMLDYKIDSTNSSIESFKTARVAGDLTPFTVALVVDMGVFGPDGLSTTSVSSTGQTITDPLQPGEHTTIQRLVETASDYEFVLHPGT